MSAGGKPYVEVSTALSDSKDSGRILQSFTRHLRAGKAAQATIDHYVGATKQFLVFAEAENLPALNQLRREHVEFWLERLHETYRPYSVRNRFVGLRTFFKWLAEEGDIERDPTLRMKLPSVEESPKDVARPEDVATVLEFLEAKKRWRDQVLVAVLYDTGMRATELADTRSDDVNLDTGELFIPKSKNKRVRTVHLSAAAIRYVDRYWRRVERSDDQWMLNGRRGKMTRRGLYWAVVRSFKDAGVDATIGPHDLRHTSASHMAASGNLGESDAMQLYGWTDPEMWRWYTGQARQQAAIDAHRRYSPLENLPSTKKRR